MINESLLKTQEQVEQLQKDKRLKEVSYYNDKVVNFSIGEVDVTNGYHFEQQLNALRGSTMWINVIVSAESNVTVTFNGWVVLQGVVNSTISLPVICSDVNTLAVDITSTGNVCINASVSGQIRHLKLLGEMYVMDNVTPTAVCANGGYYYAIQLPTSSNQCTLKYLSILGVDSFDQSQVYTRIHNNSQISNCLIKATLNANNDIQLFNKTLNTDITSVHCDTKPTKIVLSACGRDNCDFILVCLIDGNVTLTYIYDGIAKYTTKIKFTNQRAVTDIGQLHSLGSNTFSGITVSMGDTDYVMIFNFYNSASQYPQSNGYCLYEMGKAGTTISTIMNDKIYVCVVGNNECKLRVFTCKQSGSLILIGKSYATSYVGVDRIFVGSNYVYGVAYSKVAVLDEILS